MTTTYKNSKTRLTGYNIIDMHKQQPSVIVISDNIIDANFAYAKLK